MRSRGVAQEVAGPVRSGGVDAPPRPLRSAAEIVPVPPLGRPVQLGPAVLGAGLGYHPAHLGSLHVYGGPELVRRRAGRVRGRSVAGQEGLVELGLCSWVRYAASGPPG